MKKNQSEFSAIILSGGKSTRMNKIDKGLILFRNEPLILPILRVFSQLTQNIMINTNQHFFNYNRFGYPVFSDSIWKNCGPLSGILNAMIVCKTNWILFSPCDTPFVSTQLFQSLWDNKKNKTAICAKNNQNIHPLHLLIHKKHQTDLTDYLKKGGRKILPFLEEINADFLDWNNEKTFINLNDWQELAKNEQ